MYTYRDYFNHFSDASMNLERDVLETAIRRYKEVISDSGNIVVGKSTVAFDILFRTPIFLSKEGKKRRHSFTSA